ncbi:MAG: hypothetical protein EOS54_01290 [Mesorhizobium sp.]|nr:MULTISPECIES: hypothetical protein [unclassified Mesorhizobium]RVD73043.1 hypothetical protein EN751_06970 [Mesorhizobium sp. M4A.F.Ca.ET.029.04.2.1]RVC47380.1 hypothetical protein EN781_01340 [Mesorhizobium sp. M4A.F.Ca.ET.090.04.2.1]RVC81329.1 hypothetical protein EN745_10135 [Mesorhizobium sp. M4A.F.Ca.ET.022.05.2.1]RWC59569.1 MAG: hypothetical protein EOS54_01290 [Mesorhizobium sp.]TIU70578.1 MAG: hypothetical protein E5W25_06735 [Mesorhizobium sp.]
MHVQSGTRIDQAIIPGTRSRLEEGQSVDIILASDAHGAFVWGVLDRLLDEPNLVFSAVTASGFGAVEAAVLAYGLSLGGRRGARMALTNFWRRVSHASMFSIDRASLLRSILEQSIDIEQLRDERCPVKLGVLAVNAGTDAVKVFTGEQLSINAIVAAATVPFLSPPVEIDGDSYWGDGELSQLPPARSPKTSHRLIIAGRPSLFTTLCPDRSFSSTHCTTKCAPVHTIFDSQYRGGAALFARPWIDWGELTGMRDRGRQCAEGWLVADLFGIDERPAVGCRVQHI